MPVANNLLRFEDVRQALDRGLEEAGGIRVELETGGKATNFRQRCYQYCKRAREISMQTLPPNDPNYGYCVYDVLLIQREGNFVIITHRSAEGLKISSLADDRDG